MPHTAIKSFKINEEGWEGVAAIHAAIPEFGDNPGAEHYHARCAGHKTIALAAHDNGAPAGYVVAYDRYEDGSLYCWMAGVIPAYRQSGILTALMTDLEDRARSAGYDSLRIKTRNDKTAMLRWLVANGYMFTAVDIRAPLGDSRLHLRKTL